MQAIELGNIPELLPALSTSSRWSLPLSLLPTSTAPASCMSDDAEEEVENQVRLRCPFFPAVMCFGEMLWGPYTAPSQAQRSRLLLLEAEPAVSWLALSNEI